MSPDGGVFGPDERPDRVLPIDCRRYPWSMEPATPVVPEAPEPPDPSWRPGIPSLRQHLPSLVWGAALPISVYFLVRSHVHTDAHALIVAGGFSSAWVILQFVRRRTVDIVGAVVLLGFAVGVVSSTVLGGNEYVLKIRDAGFTALFGVICIVTLFTHDRPALFYVGRYLSAGSDPAKMSAFDRLHEVPMGRHAFRVLSILWGIGLVVEAGTRHGVRRRVVDGNIPRSVTLHHGRRYRQPLRLYCRLHQAGAAQSRRRRRPEVGSRGGRGVVRERGRSTVILALGRHGLKGRRTQSPCRRSPVR